MLVKDVMSSPVVTIDEDSPANQVAELMDKHGLGCIVVKGKEGKPIGIITERDMVRRILAKNIRPDSLKAREVMTSPLITVDPDKKISETARMMSRLNVRRLGVVYKGQLVGVLSSKDALAVMPELLEIIQEQALLEGENRIQQAGEEPAPLAGYCDSCGIWSDTLEEINGDFLCEDCAAELQSE
jgi:signal-transduction protein with cAMP-binding, CBS, and nucleotidyltransferase domain